MNVCFFYFAIVNSGCYWTDGTFSFIVSYPRYEVASYPSYEVAEDGWRFKRPLLALHLSIIIIALVHFQLSIIGIVTASMAANRDRACCDSVGSRYEFGAQWVEMI